MANLALSESSRARNDEAVRRIQRYVSEAILNGELGPGDRLPTERELAGRFDAARGAVRQALSRLEREGRITRHVGRGTFVSERRQELPHGVTESWREVSPSELMDARILIEPELTRLFVNQANQEDMDRLRTCITRSEAATSFEEFERWDETLHEVIVEGTKNRLLVRFYRNVTAVRREAHWGVIKRRVFNLAARREIERQHRKIVNALTERDAETARQALLDHLRSVRQSLIKV